MRPAELKNKIAIYHANFQVIKRSAGRSVVAGVAYRSAERLVDERTGEIHDYTRKSGVDDTFIMTPKGSPDWASDRTVLWSKVETTEKRKDAQLARELNVALPLELSQEQSKELLKEYVQSAFVDRGMIADVAMHNMDSNNPHAHIVLTLRDIEGDNFGKKNRDWNSRELLKEWREQWATVTNKHLEKAEHDVRIDHRSLLDQGINRLPTIHMGVHATQMEKRGIKTDRGDLNRRVLTINKAREAIVDALKKEMALVKDRVGALVKKETRAALDVMNSLLKGQPSMVDEVLGRHALEQQARDRERIQRTKLERSTGKKNGRTR